MPNCDFPTCRKEAKYELGYSYTKEEEPRPNYTEHRCEGHIFSIEGLLHPSCGFPERVYDERGELRQELVGAIKRLWRAERADHGPVYFTRRIMPSPDASSNVIVIDNFHPAWRRAAGELMKTERIKDIMESCGKRIGEWSGVPMGMEFDRELGLTHIKTPDRGSLDLWEREEVYRSHNQDSVQVVGATSAVMNEYLYWMSFILKGSSL
jgi:hypothetical protein